MLEPAELDKQLKLVRRTNAQGRRWIIRSGVLVVIAGFALYRGASTNNFIGVTCLVLAVMSFTLGRSLRRQAAELQQRIKLVGEAGNA